MYYYFYVCKSLFLKYGPGFNPSHFNSDFCFFILLHQVIKVLKYCIHIRCKLLAQLDNGKRLKNPDSKIAYY